MLTVVSIRPKEKSAFENTFKRAFGID